jgi:hypothetical protein
LITYEDVHAMVMALPDTEATTSWDSRSFKVNKKVILYFTEKNGLALKVSFDERDFLLEVAPDTFFVTDHIKNWPIVYARPESLDPDFLKDNILKVWRYQKRP